MSNEIKIVTLSDLEKKYLSYLFNDSRYIIKSIGRVTTDHLPNYGWIFDIVMSYYRSKKDIITDTVIDLFFAKKQVKGEEAIKYKTLIAELRFIDKSKLNDAEFETLIEELEEKKLGRDELNLAEYIIEANAKHMNPKELIGNIKQKINEMDSNSTEIKNEGALKDTAEKFKESYYERKNNPESFRTIPSGFRQVDKENGGFRPGELIYVIGRKGDGKSVWMLNVAAAAWEAGCNIIIFTLEISREDYERRLVARIGDVESNKLKMGTLDTVQEKLLDEYITKVKSKDNVIYIVDCPRGCSPAFVEAKVKLVEQLENINFDMVITDYSGIMVPNSHVAEKRHEQGQIALDLKRFARDSMKVVISGAQKTRAGAKSEEADSSFVAESDQIADHLDWGFDIMSLSETTGRIASFKTRDAAPVNFHFNKIYARMLIRELDADINGWDEAVLM